jgi:DoxX-like protein
MTLVLSFPEAAACLLPAAGKLTGQPKMRPSAAHFGIPCPKYRLIGGAELAAAGVVIGLWWHPLDVAAAAGMALLLIGALITHRRAEDGGEGDRTGPARPRDHPRRRGRTGRAGFGGGLQPLGVIRFPAGAGWFG